MISQIIRDATGKRHESDKRRLSRIVCPLTTISVLLACTQVWAADDCSKAYEDWNDVAAFKRCEAAASAGDAEAEFGYGLLLWSGPPASVDRRLALDWLRKSAQQGHWLAQNFLGGVLQRPELEASLRNRAEAYAWFVTARAPKSAARLRAHMSSAELRDGERLAAEFGAKYPVKVPSQGKP